MQRIHLLSGRLSLYKVRYRPGLSHPLLSLGLSAMEASVRLVRSPLRHHDINALSEGSNSECQLLKRTEIADLHTDFLFSPVCV